MQITGQTYYILKQNKTYVDMHVDTYLTADIRSNPKYHHSCTSQQKITWSYSGWALKFSSFWEVTLGAEAL